MNLVPSSIVAIPTSEARSTSPLLADPGPAARRFKALADPARVRILAFLADPAPACCAHDDAVCACDLEDVTGGYLIQEGTPDGAAEALITALDDRREELFGEEAVDRADAASVPASD